MRSVVMALVLTSGCATTSAAPDAAFVTTCDQALAIAEPRLTDCASGCDLHVPCTGTLGCDLHCAHVVVCEGGSLVIGQVGRICYVPDASQTPDAASP